MNVNEYQLATCESEKVNRPQNHKISSRFAINLSQLSAYIVAAETDKYVSSCWKSTM